MAKINRAASQRHDTAIGHGRGWAARGISGKLAVAIAAGLAILLVAQTGPALADKHETPICLKEPPKSVTPSAIKATTGYQKRQRKETRDLVAALKAQTKERKSCIKKQEKLQRDLDKKRKSAKRNLNKAQKAFDREKRKLSNLKGRLEDLIKEIENLQPKAAKQKKRGLRSLELAIEKQEELVEDDGKYSEALSGAKTEYDEVRKALKNKKADVKNAYKYIKAHRSFIKKAKAAGKKARSRLKKEAKKARKLERGKNPIKWAKALKKSAASLIRALDANKDWIPNADTLHKNYQKRASFATSALEEFTKLKGSVKGAKNAIKKANKAAKRANKAVNKANKAVDKANRKLEREEKRVGDDSEAKKKAKRTFQKHRNNIAKAEKKLERAKENLDKAKEKVDKAKEKLKELEGLPKTRLAELKKKYKILVKGAPKFETSK